MSIKIQGNQIIDALENISVAGNVTAATLSANTISATSVDANASSATLAANSTKLDGEYPAYYLEYANLTGAPTIPTTVSSLTDAADYATVDYVTDLVSTSVGSIQGFSGNYLDLTNKPTIPSTVVELSDSADYATVSALNTAIAANAANHFSGAYADLSGKPFIPSAVTDLSDNNDYALKSYVDNEISDLVNGASSALDTLKEIGDVLNTQASAATALTTVVGNKLDASAYNAADVLSKLISVDGDGSNLDSDKLDGEHGSYYLNYSNATNKPFIPSNVTDLGDESNYALKTYVTGLLAVNAADHFSGAYGDLTGVPTKVSQFTNDTGFLVSTDTIDDATNAVNAVNAQNAVQATNATNADTAANAIKLGDQFPAYYNDYDNLTDVPTNVAALAAGTLQTSILVNNSDFATNASVVAAIDNLVGAAPGVLDTLEEISNAIGGDASFASTMASQLSTKMPKAGGNFTGDVTSTSSITATGGFVGDIEGDVTGNVTGNVTGDVTGDVTGNVTGQITAGADNTLGALTTGSLAGAEDVRVDGTMRVTGQLHVGNATITIDPETDSLDLNGIKLEKDNNGDISFKDRLGNLKKAKFAELEVGGRPLSRQHPTKAGKNFTETDVQGDVEGDLTGNVIATTGTSAFNEITGAKATVTELGVTGGASFQSLLKEEVEVSATSLTGSNIDLENGMMHLFTATNTSSGFVNFRYNASTALSSKISDGETCAVTLISATSANGFLNSLRVDGLPVTVQWSGAAVPEEGGEAGYDIITVQLIRANSAWIALAAVNNFSVPQ